MTKTKQKTLFTGDTNYCRCIIWNIFKFKSEMIRVKYMLVLPVTNMKRMIFPHAYQIFLHRVIL